MTFVSNFDLQRLLHAVHWRPHFGDEDFMGWLIFFSYFVAAWLCWRAAKTSEGANRPNRIFWFIMMGAMILLGINKQLDLQVPISEIGREMSKMQGWYADRQRIMTDFIIIAGIVGGAVLTGLLVMIRKSVLRHGPALFGVMMLLFFFIVKAASIHHVDGTFFRKWAGMTLYAILELGGVIIVGTTAAVSWRRNNTMNRQNNSGFSEGS